jgi:hypothetical protein
LWNSNLSSTTSLRAFPAFQFSDDASPISLNDSYHAIVSMLQKYGLKMQAVMSFHIRETSLRPALDPFGVTLTLDLTSVRRQRWRCVQHPAAVLGA